MSTDYLSSLPEEMLEEISKFFGVDYDYNEPHQSYRALAQTCKTLRAHFQRRIFSYLRLLVNTRIRTFAELIQDNPILASYIRTIDLAVDNMCMGHFQYPPLLAIMHAAIGSFGTQPKISLFMGSWHKFVDELGVDLPSNTMTHILNAPQTILHAITDLQVRCMEQAIPVGLFRLLPNLRTLCGSSFALSSNDSSMENYTSQYFHPKLNVLMLDNCTPATIKMLCEQILDLSALEELSVSCVQIGTVDTDYSNAKRLLALRVLDYTQSIQRLGFDVGVGPFCDISQLQHLRECTLDLDVKGGTNPVPHLCQLLHTLPPLPEHDLGYLHLSFNLNDIALDANDISNSHVIFSISAWSKFDNALVDVISSGTRSFKLTLVFSIPAQNNLVKSSLKSLFDNWGRNFLPKSCQQPNLNIVSHYPYYYYL